MWFSRFYKNSGGINMKVVAIMASPLKKGHGYKVVKHIENKLKSLGKISFKYIYLKDADLKSCNGCMLCIKKGEDLCMIKDDREKIEREMLSADGVIFYSPTYGMTVSELMKRFIDRLSYNGHRPKYFHQHALFVSTTGGIGLKGTFNVMNFFEGWGFNVVSKLGLKCPPFPESEKALRKKDLEVEKTAAKFFKEMKKGDSPKPSFNKVIGFYIMKAISANEKTTKYLPADNEYYKSNGWHDKRASFFYETKVGILNKLVGKFLAVIIKAGLNSSIKV